jgi:F0F1-type ATP synthase assembly protein I
MAEPDDDQALRAKLDALKGALDRRNAEKRAKEAGGPTDSERAATNSAISMAFSAAGEFAGAIVGGGLIGWLIAFFLLGAAAGVWNVVRLTSPKAHLGDRDSRLSGGAAPDKDGRRSAPAARNEALSGADDDED